MIPILHNNLLKVLPDHEIEVVVVVVNRYLLHLKRSFKMWFKAGLILNPSNRVQFHMFLNWGVQLPWQVTLSLAPKRGGGPHKELLVVVWAAGLQDWYWKMWDVFIISTSPQRKFGKENKIIIIKQMNSLLLKYPIIFNKL